MATKKKLLELPNIDAEEIPTDPIAQLIRKRIGSRAFILAYEHEDGGLITSGKGSSPKVMAMFMALSSTIGKELLKPKKGKKKCAPSKRSE